MSSNSSQNRMDSNGQKIKQSGELFGCPGVIVQTFAKSYESHKNVRLCSASRSAQVKRRESHYSPHIDIKLRTELYKFESITKSYGFERSNVKKFYICRKSAVYLLQKLCFGDNIDCVVGVSPSGKAPDFDSGIRWFKSSYPCQ